MRTCGPCSECCTRMGVTVLGKPQEARCTHQGESGCAIYAERPGECATFVCLWVADQKGEVFRDNERPDHTGVLFAPLDQVTVGAYECRPGALDGYWARKVMTRLARRVPFKLLRMGAST